MYSSIDVYASVLAVGLQNFHVDWRHLGTNIASTSKKGRPKSKGGKDFLQVGPAPSKVVRVLT